jgi:hypothetical protein
MVMVVLDVLTMQVASAEKARIQKNPIKYNF